MKYSEDKGLKTSRWVANEQLVNKDINALHMDAYRNRVDLIASLTSRDDVNQVLNGLELTWDTAMTCSLSVGSAISFTGTYLVDTLWEFSADAGSAFVATAGGITAVVFDTGGGNNRIDIIEIRPTQDPYNSVNRTFKDPVTGLQTTAPINTKVEYGFEFRIVEGTEATTPSAPATTAGWIKLAEVYVATSASAISQADIKDIRRCADWTTEPSTLDYAKITGSNINTVHMVTEANYTLLDGDGYSHILIDTGASDRTITLPSAIYNKGRKLTLKKIADSAGNVIVDGEGAETIDGQLTWVIKKQNHFIEILCDGSNWYVINQNKFTPDGRTIADQGDSFDAVAVGGYEGSELLNESRASSWVERSDGTYYLVEAQTTNIQALSLDGSTLGSSLAMGSTVYAVSTLGVDTIVVITASTMGTYVFNGSVWALSGSTNALSGDSYTYVAVLSSTVLAVTVGTNGVNIQRYLWGGSSWGTSGSAFAAAAELTASATSSRGSARLDDDTVAVAWTATATPDYGSLTGVFRWTGTVWTFKNVFRSVHGSVIYALSDNCVLMQGYIAGSPVAILKYVEDEGLAYTSTQLSNLLTYYDDDGSYMTVGYMFIGTIPAWLTTKRHSLFLTSQRARYRNGNAYVYTTVLSYIRTTERILEDDEI